MSNYTIGLGFTVNRNIVTWYPKFLNFILSTYCFSYQSGVINFHSYAIAQENKLLKAVNVRGLRKINFTMKNYKRLV